MPRTQDRPQRLWRPAPRSSHRLQPNNRLEPPGDARNDARDTDRIRCNENAVKPGLSELFSKPWPGTRSLLGWAGLPSTATVVDL